MTMGFSISHKSATFFIGVTVVLFALSESKVDLIADQQSKPADFHSDFPTSSPRKSETNDETLGSLLSSPQQVKCEQLKRSIFPENPINNILSPEIFTQADPFRYLVDRTMKLKYRIIPWMAKTLKNHLQADEIPSCYVPYAKALSSLVQCWPNIDTAKDFIRIYQKLSLTNEFDPSYLPSDISSSPQLLQLFSAAIFSDPTPPLRIFYKLLSMPKNDVLNLVAQLQRFIEHINTLRQPTNSPYSQKLYTWYANSVRKFLQNETEFDDLRSNMNEIQHLTNTG